MAETVSTGIVVDFPFFIGNDHYFWWGGLAENPRQMGIWGRCAWLDEKKMGKNENFSGGQVFRVLL